MKLCVVGTGFSDALFEEVGERDGVILDEIRDGRVKRGENVLVRGDESRLVAVASGEILRGDDTDDFTTFCPYQQDFGVIVGEIGALHRLGDECPEFESLVRRLMVEDKIELLDVTLLFDEEETAEEFLGNGERRLPNLRFADL